MNKHNKLICFPNQKDGKLICFPSEKKAAEGIVVENIIFIVLNLLFFVVMLIFVYNSGNNSLVLEQKYAKEIALIIDNAKPEMSVVLNAKEITDAAKKDNLDMNKIILLDKKNNLVMVNLKEKGGYSFEYFSNYDVDVSLDKEWISINVKEIKK